METDDHLQPQKRRGRGRPPKPKPANDAPTVVSLPKPRGRPPKERDRNLPAESPTPGRKRGRPPKKTMKEALNMSVPITQVPGSSSSNCGSEGKALPAGNEHEKDPAANGQSSPVEGECEEKPAVDVHKKEQTTEEVLATTHSAEAETKMVTSTPARDGMDYLCTTLCDMLFCLPKKGIPNRSLKIVKDLEKCYENDSYKPTEDNFYIDLRGGDAEEAIEFFKIFLEDTFDTPTCLNFIVGCKVHGVGDGVLKKEIVGLLDSYKDIEPVEAYGGSLISINVGPNKLKEEVTLMPVTPPQVFSVTPEMEAEQAKIMNYKKRPLCTVACDLLLGLRRPKDQHFDDENMRLRLMTGLNMCYNYDSGKVIEDESTVDLRGLFVEEAIQQLVKHLNQRACSLETRSLKVRVGCKVHGVGEGRLKQAVIDTLKSDKDIEFDEDDDDFIISIKLEGLKSYSFLEGVIDELRYSDDDLDSVCSFSSFHGKSKGSLGDSKETVPDLINSMVGHGSLKSRVEDREGFPCTIVCDLLFDLPMPPEQSQDEKIIGKVLADHEKRDENDSYKVVESSWRVNLHSTTIDESIKLLALHLGSWSCPTALECRKPIVACKLHGFKEKRLTQAIIGLSKSYKVVVEEKSIDSIISIIFDAGKNHSPKQIVPSDFSSYHVAGTKGTDEEVTMEVGGTSAAKGEAHLCTILCDLIFSLSEPRTGQRRLKVLTALEQCYKNDGYEKDGDIFFIDLRGMYADNAKILVIITLASMKNPPQYLNFIVGCKVHGVGEGKLRKAILGLLKLDKDILLSNKWGDSVVSVELGRKRFPLLCAMDIKFSLSIRSDGSISLASGDMSSSVDYGKEAMASGLEGFPFDISDNDDVDVDADGVAKMGGNMEAVVAIKEKYKGRSLCTVACDFLFGLRRPRDEKMRKKVLTCVQSCNQDNGLKFVESTNLVDLRGWFAAEAIEELIKHLNLARLTPLGLLLVIVGCNIHGVGDGKLKQAIIALLNSDKDIEYSEDIGYIIAIKVDAKQDYRSLKEVSCFLAHSDDDFDSLSSETETETETDEGFFTIHCELFGPPRQPHQCGDEEIIAKVNLCGRSMDDLIKLIILHLDCWSEARAPEYVDFIVGCKLHGLCGVDFRQKIKDMLEGKIEWKVEEENGGATFFITFKVVRRTVVCQGTLEGSPS